MSYTMYNRQRDLVYNDPEVQIGVPVGSIDKPTYPKFINKVLFCVLLQLIITMGACITGYIYRSELINIIQKDPRNFYIPIICFIISGISLACCRTSNKACLYTTFALFTLSSAVVVTISILPYSPVIVLQAATGTTITVSFTNMYAFWCSRNNIDMSPYTGALVAVSIAIIPLIMLQIFIFPHSAPFQIFFSILFMIIFTLYLMFDLNQLYIGNTELIFEDPIYAAVSIYLDIINIFLYMLELLNACNNNE